MSSKTKLVLHLTNNMLLLYTESPPNIKQRDVTYGRHGVFADTHEIEHKRENEANGQGMAAIGAVQAPVELSHTDEATLQVT